MAEIVMCRCGSADFTDLQLTDYGVVRFVCVRCGNRSSINVPVQLAHIEWVKSQQETELKPVQVPLPAASSPPLPSEPVTSPGYKYPAMF